MSAKILARYVPQERMDEAVIAWEAAEENGFLMPFPQALKVAMRELMQRDQEEKTKAEEK